MQPSTSDQALSKRIETLERAVTTLGELVREGQAQRASLQAEIRTLEARLESGQDHLVGADQGMSPVVAAALERLSHTTTRTRDLVAAQNADLARLLTHQFKDAVHRGLPIVDLIPASLERTLLRKLLDSQSVLSLIALLRARPKILGSLSLATTQEVYTLARKFGYYREQIGASRRIDLLSGNSRKREMVESEYAVMVNPFRYVPDLPRTPEIYDTEGPIVHLVGKALPDTQSGYTLRTHYSVKAQIELGLDVRVVCQPDGQGVNGARRSYSHDEIPYIILAGSARNKQPLKAWIRSSITALAAEVALIRPCVLHAHSDFINAVMAIAVGEACGIPVVYESRGFWEESWLSRMADTLGLGLEYEHLFDEESLPEAYTLRKAAEEAVRQKVDRNLTLSSVMMGHILSAPGGAHMGTIALVPNAVDSTALHPVERDIGLLHQLGVNDEDVVVGAVTSVVEYEGLDTLLDAHDLLVADGLDVHLLIVGGGPYHEELAAHAQERGIARVTFAGKVDHSEVPRYYSLMDIIVVPRRPTVVSRLVTPLKPFEALATGHPLVVSDVAPLREIADDSDGVVSTFQAGDAQDLASALRDLVSDPLLRRQKADQGREWVSTTRTWRHNAITTAEVYTELGSLEQMPLLLQAMDGLANSGEDWEGLLSNLRTQPDLPASGWFQVSERLPPASTVLTDGWLYGTMAPIDITAPIEWESLARVNRSWAFGLHAWNPLDSVLRAYDESGDRHYLEISLGFALDWVKAHPPWVFTTTGEDDGSMAYYDMALSMRVPRLAALLSRASKFHDLRAAHVVLADLLVHERQMLRTEYAFTSQNNHGVFSAAAQLHIEKFFLGLTERQEVLDQASERMREVLSSQFAEDGGHLEHSPQYHELLVRSVTNLLDLGLIDDPATAKRLRSAQDVLGWMVQPNGALAHLGDTSLVKFSTKTTLTVSETTDFILTDGQRGTPHEASLLPLYESGYAFVRHPQPARPGERALSSYLALQAGFHSRAHKHADDLTLTWFDRGQEILVDGGRFGYGPLLDNDSQLRKQGFYYDSEERQYVESTLAHSTLMVDGVIQDRRRKPYGSALVDCTQQGDIFRIEARAVHSDYIHRRVVRLHAGQDLLLQDSVYSSQQDQREATFWLLLNGDLDLAWDGQTITASSPRWEHDLLITGEGQLIGPVKGERSPLRGWRAISDGSLVEAWSLGFSVPFVERATHRTRLTFQDEA